MARVLLVEDRLRERRILAAVLAASGYDVVEAGSGLQAVEALKSESINVVVLDLRLPGGVSGYDVLRLLPPGKPVPPVIVMTAYSNETTLRDGIRWGVREYLEKPFDNSTLIDAVARIAGQPPRRPSSVGGRESRSGGASDGFHWRPAPNERAFVEQLAHERGISMNDALRALVRRAMRQEHFQPPDD